MEVTVVCVPYQHLLGCPEIRVLLEHDAGSSKPVKEFFPIFNIFGDFQERDLGLRNSIAVSVY